MSVSGEKLNLLIMRDSGETKRFRVRRSSFRLVVAFFMLSPIFAALALWACFVFWQDKAELDSKILLLESQVQDYSVQVKRLSNLEELLKEDERLTASIEQNTTRKTTSTEGANANENDGKDPASNEEKVAPETLEGQEEVLIEDGPGHVDFETVDAKKVSVENVQNRLVSAKRIRISFDLRNAGTATASGKVTCSLSLASGETIPLTLTPENVGNYKIQRWKKAVMFANFTGNHDLSNAQVIIEVLDDKDKLIYRNLFALDQ